MQTAILMFIFLIAVSACLIYSHRNKRVEKDSVIFDPEEYLLLSAEELELLNLINEFRISIGIKPLIAEKLACEVCENEITLNKFRGHKGIEERAKQSNAKDYSEICTFGYTTPISIFNAYCGSKGHRETIEQGKYTHIGISIKNKTNYCLLTNY